MKSITEQLVVIALIADAITGAVFIGHGIRTTFTDPFQGWIIIPIGLLLWFSAWAIWQGDYSGSKQNI